MRGGNPQNSNTLGLSKVMKQKFASTEVFTKFVFPNGAIMSCAVCGRENTKTPQEMEKYLKKWPRCCNVPANVRPK